MIIQKYKKSAKLFVASVLNKTEIIKKNLKKPSILILMYHRVNDDYDFLGLTINKEIFCSQIKCLNENFEVISLNDAVLKIKNNSVDKNYCVITFDDGYRDNFEIVAPILIDHNLPITIFVTYDAIERGQFGWKAFDEAILKSNEKYLDLSCFGIDKFDLKNSLNRELTVVKLHSILKKIPDSLKKKIVEYVLSRNISCCCSERFMMNWDEICKLSSNQLFTIGAHTITHPILSRVADRQVTREIAECKTLLEDKIKKPVHYFAYPNGGFEDYDENVVSVVKNAGYRAACTTLSGINTSTDDLFELRRVDVTPYMSTDNCGVFNSNMFLFSLSQIFNR